MFTIEKNSIMVGIVYKIHKLYTRKVYSVYVSSQKLIFIELFAILSSSMTCAINRHKPVSVYIYLKKQFINYQNKT